MKAFPYLIAIVVFISSCHKDEKPIAPHPPGDDLQTQITLGRLYEDQVWFDLESNTEVSRNKKTIWDLAFECRPEGKHITLNSANNMRAALSGITDIGIVIDTNGMQFKWDEASGNLDSTAIGDWTQNNEIYVIDGGTDEVGNHRGMYKLFIDSLIDSTFYFRFAGWTDTEWTSASVQKEGEYFFAYFSFNTNEQLRVAPPKATWDFVFTQYTYAFYELNPPIPYLVTGVLLNPRNALSAKVFDQPFAEINLNNSQQYPFNSRQDNVGFDWKTFDLNAGYYTVHSNQNYVITTHSGKLYKMHFLDWYNSNGVKGTATIEYAEL